MPWSVALEWGRFQKVVFLDYEKLLFILIIVLIGCGESIREPFTKEAWAPREVENRFNHRMLYTGDLKANLLSKGMGRSEIIDLLVEPELNASILIGYSVFEEVKSCLLYTSPSPRD